MFEFFSIVLLAVLFFVGVYVFHSFAFMSIAGRSNLKFPRLAWIPIFGPLIVMYHVSKMHWWPWVVIGLSVILSFFTSLNSMFGVFNVVLFFVVFVIVIIWLWKTFVAMRRPGWWSLVLVLLLFNVLALAITLLIIGLSVAFGGAYLPSVFLLIALFVSLFVFFVLFHVFIGVATWGTLRK